MNAPVLPEELWDLMPLKQFPQLRLELVECAAVFNHNVSDTSDVSHVPEVLLELVFGDQNPPGFLDVRNIFTDHLVFEPFLERRFNVDTEEFSRKSCPEIMHHFRIAHALKGTVAGL